MYKSLFLIAICLTLFSCSQTSKKSCENNDPKIVSKQVYLDYFNSIKGKRCVSGQFIRWNYNASLQEITAIHDSSNQWLGMLGADYYGNFQDSIPSPKCEYKLSNDVIKSYYKKNGIVNLSVHFINPQNGGSAWFYDMDFDSILIKDSRINKIFMTELDSVAVGLKDLCDAGVMVMFRPFHEMNGKWFWWGQRDGFVNLWKMTYDYIVNVKGLDNMIWCWSPDAWAEEYDKYYPGDKYVDMVGLDAYTPNLPAIGDAYTNILKYNKPFGFTEYGCQAGPVFYEKIDFDYSIFLTWINESFPKCTFFLAWRDAKGMVDKPGVRKLLNDSIIINREEIMELVVSE